MPHSSASPPEVTGGSTATTTRPGSTCRRALAFSSVASDQSAPSTSVSICPVELLPAEPAALIFRSDLFQESFRQMHSVGRRGRVGQRGGRLGDDGTQQGAVARGGGDDLARLPAQPQPELQHVPGVLALLPFGELVAPGAVELGAPQALRLARREDLRDRAVRPDQPLARRLPLGLAVGRRAGHQPAVAEDHDLARLVERLAQKSDPGTTSRVAWFSALNLRADPFRTRARLARPPSAQDHPGGPVAFGGQLMPRQRPMLEEKGQRGEGIGAQFVQEPVQLTLRQPRQQVSQRSRPGRRRGRARRPFRLRMLWIVFQRSPRYREPTAGASDDA